jgi:polyisoprenyl-phosphate glycosyltransferase
MAFSPSPIISVVIPVYNSEGCLRELVGRLLNVMAAIGEPYEVILIDDGSPDRSWDEVVALAQEFTDQVCAVRLMRNFGQHNALMCGFHYVRGKYVITMDDDLQNPPEEIPKLFEAIERSEADVVYGIPHRKEHKWWRNAGSALVGAFYRIVFRSRIQPSPFRIIRREVVDAILTYSLNYTYVDGLLAWNTQRIQQVEVDHRARAVGRSGYSLRKLVVLAFNLFTNFSLIPLQIVSLVGILAAFAGLATGAYYLALYAFSRITVPGYASIIVAVLVLGGLQLLALGIHGEYLGRLHLNINHKPQYVVRTFCGSRLALVGQVKREGQDCSRSIVESPLNESVRLNDRNAFRHGISDEHAA